MGRLDDIAERNTRAMRTARRKLAWVGAIVVALVAIAIALAAGLGVPSSPAHSVAPAHDSTRVDDVRMR